MYKRYFPKILIFSLVAFFLLSTNAFATHNRAGDITVEQIGSCDQLFIRATITTYTKASSTMADRDSLTICWGDGFCESVPRSNGFGQILSNDTKVNYYTATHSYAGRGTYKISMSDPNRIEGIININGGSSVQIPFYIETVYTFLNSQFQGCNSTPVLLQPPIDVGCVGKVFRHNPNAFDPDGDSLSYKLAIPLQVAGQEVPNYLYPFQVNPGPNNLLELNEVTGDLTWATPQAEGDYNIAILIIEYRNGSPIDTVIRDMQIRIENCDNLPPEVVAENRICVVAGETLEFDVVATAPIDDADQKVLIQAFGGPLVIDDPAEFNVALGFQDQPLTGTFKWQTQCHHISDNFYSVIFRAQDNFPVITARNDTSFLSTLQTTRIKVVGPAPEDVQAESGQGQVRISWASPYSCEDAKDNYFYGFSVWRKEGSTTFPIDTCSPGLEGRGYTEIRFRTRELENGRYFYVDEDVERGKTYCYRVLARFAKTTTSGQPYNLVESLPSKEVCVQLSRDIPLITNVDVLETSSTDGKIMVAWSKPRAEDLDTLQNPGPYTYIVKRATGITNAGFLDQPDGVFTSNDFANANDTIYIDTTGINTQDNPYSYVIEFYVNGESEPLGDTENASSVFLNVASTDNLNILSWDFEVPWLNEKYTVYRDDNADGVYDSIALVTQPMYNDPELNNGQEYCYYIKATGTYGIDGIADPLINHSQIACGVPLDTVPPCPPPFTVDNFCAEEPDPELIDLLENRLTWTNPEIACSGVDDVLGYNIYYATSEDAEFELIATIEDETETVFYNQTPLGLAGCYAVTAFDSLRNESNFGEIICKDNCPKYELPNVFTPNGDGQNDLFIPYPYRFIESVDFQVFNRWGGLVFETTNPDLNWDGTNLRDEPLSDGVYYYTCKVFEQRIDGVLPSSAVLSGYIELVRESN
ncbi:MAG: gliding motility-associated C-terminal domain-containing protein [Saprospiraceae bacterium]